LAASIFLIVIQRYKQLRFRHRERLVQMFLETRGNFHQRDCACNVFLQMRVAYIIGKKLMVPMPSATSVVFRIQFFKLFQNALPVAVCRQYFSSNIQ
jgi:hypothetical protein